jgi:hypothetical protein
MGLGIWCWNKISFITVGVKRVTTTEKKRDMCSQILKLCWQVFRFWGSFSPWISSIRHDIDKGILSWSNETFSWGYQKKRPMPEVKPMDALGWQCARTHIAINPLVSGETRDNSRSIISLPAWSSTSGLFFISQIKSVIERPMFWVDWPDKGKFARESAQHHEWSVSALFRKMQTTLGAMYSKWRGLLWRRQGRIAP